MNQNYENGMLPDYSKNSTTNGAEKIPRKIRDRRLGWIQTIMSVVATVQVASAPKSTNYRRNDMAEKSSQMKQRELPEAQQTKKQAKSQVRPATIGQCTHHHPQLREDARNQEKTKQRRRNSPKVK